MPVDHDKIKSLREKQGLSQDAAAVAAGLKSRQAWWNVESGMRSNVTVETLEKIAKALGVKARDLLT